MSDDERDQEQTADERETAEERVEREHRRMDDDDSDTVSEDRASNDGPIRPSQPEPADEAVQGKDEERLDVPQITIGRASQLDSAAQISDRPTHDRSIQVPQIQTRSRPVLDADEMAEIGFIEPDTGTIDAPQFTLGTTNRIDPLELDDDQLEGIGLIQQSQIPQVTVKNQHRIQPFSTFLETIPEITEDTSVEAERDADELAEGETQTAADVTEVKEGTADAFSEFDAGDGWATGEWPDPLELLLGSGGTGVKSDNPLVVWVDDDARADNHDPVGIVETLVKRRYREIEGGEPESKKLDNPEQLAGEERWMSADSQIFTAELDDEEWEKLTDGEYQEVWRRIYQSRLDQLHSGQQFGAIIFNRSSDTWLEISSHHPPTQVKPEQEVDLIDFARVYWTDLDKEPPERRRTFSQIFDWDVNGIAQDRWEKIRGDEDGKFKFATNRDNAASDEHFALKVFVVKWLAERLWDAGDEFGMYDRLADIEDYLEIEEEIPTEQPLSEDDKDDEHVRPDIKYGSQVFEVEMFFGEADESGFEAKLQKTVRKYEDVDDIDTINIVVDNLTCILHLADLAQFKRNHQPWEVDYANINLYTVDLGREELVSMSEIVDGMTSLSPP